MKKPKKKARSFLRAFQSNRIFEMSTSDFSAQGFHISVMMMKMYMCKNPCIQFAHFLWNS